MVILRQEGVQTVPARQERFDPLEFFQTGSGLWVWGNFREWIAEQTRLIKSVSEMQLVTFTLTETATAAEIQAELPTGHVFEDLSILCCHLAGMIEAQAGGIEGVLLNNGEASTFYVQVAEWVLMVIVSWNVDDSEWCVGANCLDSNDWIAGQRIFSAADFD